MSKNIAGVKKGEKRGQYNITKPKKSEEELKKAKSEANKRYRDKCKSDPEHFSAKDIAKLIAENKELKFKLETMESKLELINIKLENAELKLKLKGSYIEEVKSKPNIKNKQKAYIIKHRDNPTATPKWPCDRGSSDSDKSLESPKKITSEDITKDEFKKYYSIRNTVKQKSTKEIEDIIGVEARRLAIIITKFEEFERKWCIIEDDEEPEYNNILENIKSRVANL